MTLVQHRGVVQISRGLMHFKGRAYLFDRVLFGGQCAPRSYYVTLSLISQGNKGGPVKTFSLEISLALSKLKTLHE